MPKERKHPPKHGPSAQNPAPHNISHGTPGRRRVIDGRGIPLVSTYLKTPRSEITRAAEAIDQMADDMRLLAARNGDVTEDDLSLIGWKLAQIRKHGTAARERACELETAA